MSARSYTACLASSALFAFTQPAFAIEPLDFFDALSGYCSRFPSVWLTAEDFDGFGYKHLSSISFGGLGSFSESKTAKIFRVPSKPKDEIIAILAWDKDSRSCMLVTTVADVGSDFASELSKAVANSYLSREMTERIEASDLLKRYVWSTGYIFSEETVEITQDGRFVSAELKLVFNTASNP